MEIKRDIHTSKFKMTPEKARDLARLYLTWKKSSEAALNNSANERWNRLFEKTKIKDGMPSWLSLLSVDENIILGKTHG